jgi:hypothetical protein
MGEGAGFGEGRRNGEMGSRNSQPECEIGFAVRNGCVLFSFCLGRNWVRLCSFGILRLAGVQGAGPARERRGRCGENWVCLGNDRSLLCREVVGELGSFVFVWYFC